MSMIDPFWSQRFILTLTFLILAIGCGLIFPESFGMSITKGLLIGIAFGVAVREDTARWIWKGLRLP